MNRVNRHIPTLIDKMEQRVKIFKDRIDYYNNVMQKQISIREECYLKIFDQRTQIRLINTDIEMIHDPSGRPIGTGQENSKVERLLLSLETKIKRFEIRIHKLQIRASKADSVVNDCAYKIDALTDKYLGYDQQIESYRQHLRQNMFREGGEYLDQEPAIDVEFKIIEEDKING